MPALAPGSGAAHHRPHATNDGSSCIAFKEHSTSGSLLSQDGLGCTRGRRRVSLLTEVVAMTQRLPCPAAPGPLEDYTSQFDPLLARLAQRRGFRAYLQGLLLPRDRNKTLTALAGAEPVVGA